MYVFFYIAEPVKDYSIIVSPDCSKEEILARLSEFQGLTTNRTETRLRQSLGGHLKRNHPVHGQVQKLSNQQLKKMCNKLGLSGHNRDLKRMHTKIITYFFKNFPEGPLACLLYTSPRPRD